MRDCDHMEGVTSRVKHRVTPSHGRCQAVREQGEKNQTRRSAKPTVGGMGGH